MAKAGLSTGNAGPFPAVQTITEGDVEIDPASFRVERLDCEVRIVDTGKDYSLQVRWDGEWQLEMNGMRDPTSAGHILARKDIKPVDSDAFGRAVSSLPNPHPYVTMRRDKQAQSQEKFRLTWDTLAERRRQSDDTAGPAHNHAAIDHFLAQPRLLV
jgi:hypothetical protein